MKAKAVNCIPIAIISLLAGYSWAQFIFTDNAASWRHYVGLVLLCINLGLYFLKFTEAVAFTGLVLLLGVFNIVAFTATIITFGITDGSSETPGIQLISVGVLIIYLIINGAMLVESYLDFKERRSNSKVHKDS